MARMRAPRTKFAAYSPDQVRLMSWTCEATLMASPYGATSCGLWLCLTSAAGLAIRMLHHFSHGAGVSRSRRTWQPGTAGCAAAPSLLSLHLQVEPRIRMTGRELSYTVVPGSFPTTMTPLSAFAVHGTVPAATAGNASAPGTDTAAAGDAGTVDFTVEDVDALGVLMKVSTGGTVGRVSITNLVTTLTTGLVLSQAVGVFVQVRAKQGCCRRRGLLALPLEVSTLSLDRGRGALNGAMAHGACMLWRALVPRLS